MLIKSCVKQYTGLLRENNEYIDKLQSSFWRFHLYKKKFSEYKFVGKSNKKYIKDSAYHPLYLKPS